jgi:hypothetical protein
MPISQEADKANARTGAQRRAQPGHRDPADAAGIGGERAWWRRRARPTSHPNMLN